MRIGVTYCGNEGKQQAYLDWLRSFFPAAGLAVLSKTDVVGDLLEFNGLVLTGGEDIDPEYSKAAPAALVKETDRARDAFEFRMLGLAMKNKLPVLGICRGLQVINVYFGGTLTADLRHDGFQNHETAAGQPELRHAVTVYEGSLLKSITGMTQGEVNSYHHQAAKEVAHDLAVSAYTVDGVVESLEWKEKEHKPFLLAVQWHPERMKDALNPFAQKIGEALLKAAQRMSINQ